MSHSPPKTKKSHSVPGMKPGEDIKVSRSQSVSSSSSQLLSHSKHKKRHSSTLSVMRRASAVVSNPDEASRDDLLDILRQIVAVQSDAGRREKTHHSHSSTPSRKSRKRHKDRRKSRSDSDDHDSSTSGSEPPTPTMSTPRLSLAQSDESSTHMSSPKSAGSRRQSVESGASFDRDQIVRLEVEPLDGERVRRSRAKYDRRCSFEDFEIEEKMLSTGRRMSAMLKELNAPRRSIENGLLSPGGGSRALERTTSLHDSFVAKLKVDNPNITPRSLRQDHGVRVDPNVDNDSGWIPLSPSAYLDDMKLEIVLNNLPVFVRPNYRCGDFDGSYADNLFCTTHFNFALLARNLTGPPMVISARFVASFGLKPSLMLLVRHAHGDERLRIPLEPLKPHAKIVLSEVLKTLQHNSQFKNTLRQYVVERPVLLDARVPQKLCEYERDDFVSQFKFGIVLVKSGQRTDDEYLLNDLSAGSADFEDFLEWMGDRISLQGWTLFAGGLDTSERRLHGVDSLYTTVSGREIHFHVGPMIPNGTDAQSVERKRHIGNDIVVIVFIDDPEETYNPESLASNFTHAIAAVRVGKRDPAGRATHYSISLVHSTAFKPLDPMPVWVALDGNQFAKLMPRTPATRLFLLSTLMNLEISSYHGSKFRPLLASTKKHNLKEIVEKHALPPRAKPPHGLVPSWLRV